MSVREKEQVFSITIHIETIFELHKFVIERNEKLGAPQGATGVA